MKLDEKEIEYSILVDNPHRKKYAQFFTPYVIAKFLASYIMSAKKEVKHILEPAFGLGVFTRALRDETQYESNITAFDIDEKIIFHSKDIINQYNVNLHIGDYLSNWGLSADGIICNPPYFKFHDYDNLASISTINTRLGTKLSGFTNIYALFILKSLSELSPNARAAYIVPSEFFNADYGVEVKRWIIKNKMLKYVINFNFDSSVFDGAITTATMLLFENSDELNDIEFFNIDSIDDLKEKTFGDFVFTKLKNTFRYKLNDLDPTIKWRNYYQHTITYNSKKLVSFKKYCRASRGIATGANNYFVFNQAKAEEFSIKNENLIPCICKSSDIQGVFFNEENLKILWQANRNVMLVDLRIFPDEHINNYIQIGIDANINRRFLTMSRNPWYALENKEVADIWVGVFNRDSIKFIENTSRALNLTTFHGIYIHHHYRKYKDAIFAFFLTSLCKELLDGNRREYGNGLSKYEPNDFNNSRVFDFSSLTEFQLSEIDQFITNLRDAEFQSQMFMSIVKHIDNFYRSLL